MCHMKRKFNTRRMTFLGLGVAVAMLLSYVEFLLPPIWSSVPGIKIGLANIIIVYLFFKSGALDAAMVSLVRLFLSALLFGSFLTFLYSLAGAVLSFLVMLLLKKSGWFSEVGVSIGGGVFHNLGQILVAIAETVQNQRGGGSQSGDPQQDLFGVAGRDRQT